jgi:hypothetical protein
MRVEPLRANPIPDRETQASGPRLAEQAVRRACADRRATALQGCCRDLFGRVVFGQGFTALAMPICRECCRS